MARTLAEYMKSPRVEKKTAVDHWFDRHPEIWNEIIQEVKINNKYILSSRMVWHYLVDIHDYPFSDGTIDLRVGNLRRAQEDAS